MNIQFFHQRPSLRGRTWSINTDQLPDDHRLVQAIAQHRFPNPLDREQFLNPSFKELMPDPSTIPHMDEAITHAIQALETPKSIAILADYDVDGGTSAALLSHYISHICHHTPLLIIPHRITEGYGPKKSHVDQCLQYNIQTLFMLDCGTAAHDVVTYAHTHGITVIILDHHTPADPNDIPTICVNPMLGKNSTLQSLCAAGVTFMFLIALQRALRSSATLQQLPDLHTYLDLVAVGTLCDMVPLVQLNRVFVQRGLQRLSTSPFPGMRALIQTLKTIDEGAIGFQVGPMLNAGSRMGSHDAAAQLLTTQNSDQADALCAHLLEQNTQRKKLLQDSLVHALEQAAYQRQHHHIVLSHAQWSPGILGLIAARVSEHFHKPTWVITHTSSPAKGAARSPIHALHLAHIIHHATQQNVITNGGGHRAAAGFTIPQGSIEHFREWLNTHYTYTSAPPSLTIEGPLPSPHIHAIHQAIDQLRPFGMGNPEPCFVLPNVTNMTVHKQTDTYALYNGTYQGTRIRFARFADASCPIRAHCAHQNTTHIAGTLNVSGPYASIHIKDGFAPQA